ncbi:MAG: hypothetical protein R3E01_26260 [Pirellulaceae bacterium]|nr:hypothetical protein [Planctomycetales bacterium]
MSYLQQLWGTFSCRYDVQRLADGIVAACLPSVVRRLSVIADAMHEDELRGYIRAKAGRIVAQHVDRVYAADTTLRPSDRESLFDFTVIGLVAALMAERRAVAVPIRVVHRKVA